MKRALFPGTFDPITLGHLNLIERSARLVDELIVLVADAVHKDCLFTQAERVEMAHVALADHAHIKVMPFNGLLVDMATTLDATLVIRGLRGSPDFEYERQIALVNKTLHPGLETIYVASPPELICVASSLVREIASLHGDVSAFVTPEVAHVLMERFNHVS